MELREFTAVLKDGRTCVYRSSYDIGRYGNTVDAFFAIANQYGDCEARRFERDKNKVIYIN